MHYSTMCLYGLGVCRSWWGAFAKCTTGASRILLTRALTADRSAQEQTDSAALSALPCQHVTLMLGSCSPCSDLRKDTEQDTLFLFPDPLVLVGSTGSSCSHGCREGSAGRKVPRAAPLSEHQSTGIAVLCQAAVTPGEGWWPWELTAGATYPELALLPRLLPGHRKFWHWC